MHDFIKRYEQGAPWEGISHEEAVTRSGLTAADRTPQDPTSLATITSRLRQRSPGILSQLVGGAGGQDMNPVAKAAVAGIAAIAMKRMMGARGGAP